MRTRAETRASHRADVVVVGAGHNGLVTACYLARAGFDVTVVEAAPTIGGMTSTNPMAPEAPEYLINEASIQASLFRATTIERDLELGTRFGLRMTVIDPAHVQMGPGGESIALWRDPARTADEIRRFSERDARAWLELNEVIDAAVQMGMPLMQTSPVRPDPRQLMRSLRAVVRGRRQLAAIGRWVMASHQEAVEERFETDLVRAALLIGLPFQRFDTDGGGWALIYLGVLRRYGVAMFHGGTGALPAALERCLTAAGGRVITDEPVEELLMHGDRVAGVRTSNGTVVEARHAVVTACSPKTTLTRLLPSGVLPPRLENRARHIPTATRGICDYKLNIALKGRLTLPRHTKWRGDDVDLRLGANSFNSYRETLDAAAAAAAGEIPDHVPGLAQITTAFDPTMAPPGCDTYWFWSGLTPTHPREGWDVARREITARAIKDAALYYEGIEELEIARRPLVRPDIEERFFAIDGSIYHVDPVPTRFGPLKPALGFGGYRTVVPGLYLTGSGTHPVAGISGIPGQNAAVAVLRDLKGVRTRRGVFEQPPVTVAAANGRHYANDRAIV